MPDSKEMPTYKCHKVVRALKIAKIRPADESTEGTFITPADEGYSMFEVSPEYVAKHEPKVGGYYVVYDNGYKSWSPAEAFEDGYTLLD